MKSKGNKTGIKQMENSKGFGGNLQFRRSENKLAVNTKVYSKKKVCVVNSIG
jgi:hypothetical protein